MINKNLFGIETNIALSISHLRNQHLPVTTNNHCMIRLVKLLFKARKQNPEIPKPYSMLKTFLKTNCQRLQNL